MNGTVAEVRKAAPDPALVKMLEEMLEDAKKGEIQGMVGVTIFDSSETGEFWVQPDQSYQTAILSDRMVGTLTRVIHKIMKRMTQDELEMSTRR